MRQIRVAVILYQDISPLHLAIPCTLFGEHYHDPAIPPPRLQLCALEPGALRSSVGLDLSGAGSLRGLDGCDLVIVPGWPSALPPAQPRLLAALRRAHARGAVLVGLCLGAFVLGEAGLLEGRSATTHWLKADELARRHPTTRVDPNVLYLDEGNMVTSAGSAAALDCCLHLFRRFHGAQAALRLARRLVVPPHRQGGQSQFIERFVEPSPQDDAFSRALDWTQKHLDQPLKLDDMAAKAHLSRRHFSRRFRQAMGISVRAWVQARRLEQAQALLQTSRLSMEELALACGFGSAVSLRQQFKEAFKVSPSAYRREFSGP
jgi:transcriptional regulator GlxA family with amidase domain